MVKMIFSVNEDCDWCNTQCPHADFVLRVGSELCCRCKYNVFTNFINSCVYCACPDDKKLEELPK